MCTIPPAPPPLPSTVPSNHQAKFCDDPPSLSCSDVCKWTAHEPRLWETCSKNNICLEEPPYRYKYKHFESIIQIGPTCGLVALSMLLNGEVAPEELMNITKLEGFSNNGEMLSCKNMAKLAEKAISLADMENVNCFVKSGGLFTKEIILELLNGSVLLVPYDADFNHSPCLRHGHTAHWALVCGVIIISEPENSYIDNPKNVYVLCRHGKSKFVAAWTLHDLDKSNKNLWEFSPKKQEDGLLYILPEGGLGGDDGLRDQFLLFNNL